MTCGSLFKPHHWGQWVETEKGDIETWRVTQQKAVITGKLYRQERVCARCGLKQYKQTKHDLND